MVVIIDYNVGNLGSISNMLKKIGIEHLISNNKDDIAKADRLILPGVGAFDTGMKNLEKFGLIDVLNEIVIKKSVKILGICLGMQLLTKKSEEGSLPGLGWINADTIKFNFEMGNNSHNYKIPHMGWNTINEKQSSQLFAGVSSEQRFYFVHSYYVKCQNEKNILTTTSYGIEFASAIIEGNIVGVQFHPEKSHKFGMNLLKNFCFKV